MKKSIIIGLFAALTVTSFTSCLDTESDRFVSADKELTLQDSVFQMLGVLTNIKGLATRYVVLGEVRGDLVKTTPYATTDLKELNDFSASENNSYISKKEYYKVINQCNYIIEYGKALQKERAAALTLRAWTYLQMVLNYGQVKYYDQFIDTDQEANADYNVYKLDALLPILINQLEGVKEVKLPSYGTIGGVDIKTQLLDVKFVLGDLYLWDGQYEKAAQLYYDLITNKSTGAKPFMCSVPYETDEGGSGVSQNYTSFVKWKTDRYQSMALSWGRFLNRESISTINIPIADSSSVRSNIDTLCGIPLSMEGKERISITATEAAKALWRSSEYAYVPDEAQYVNSPALMYISPQEANYDNPGDLRMTGSFTNRFYISELTYYMLDDSLISKYSTLNTGKYNPNKTVSLCRIATLYLRYAEAVNRAGKPGLAMVALKYGLSNDNINMYMPRWEKKELEYIDGSDTRVKCPAFSYDKKKKQILSENMILTLPKALLDEYNWVLPIASKGSGSFVINPGSDTLYYCFNDRVEPYYNFSSSDFNNNFGLHSRGSGCAAADTTYMMPHQKYPGDQVLDASVLEKRMNYMDSIICNEYAMETAFEGGRFQDLMRFSRHEGNPDFLLERMERKDPALRTTLSGGTHDGWHYSSWYLLPNQLQWTRQD